jgi:hypothetical protein
MLPGPRQDMDDIVNAIANNWWNRANGEDGRLLPGPTLPSGVQKFTAPVSEDGALRSPEK